MDELYIKDSAHSRGVPIIRDKSHQILIDYITLLKPAKVLEIGTAVGYSGIAMLKSYDKLHLTTIEHNSELAAEAKKNFEDAGVQARVDVICDDCLVKVAEMVADDKYNDYFDFIFLDGPKAQYGNMIDGLVMLLKKGGAILADNVLFRGYVNNTEEMPNKRFKTIVKRLQKFIDVFLNYPDLKDTTLIDIDDGMLFGYKK